MEVIQDSGYDVGNIIHSAVFPEFLNANFVVQFWKGSYRTDSLTGRSCFELRVDQNQTFHINGCDEGDRSQLSHYMTQSALCTIKSYDNEVEGQREGGVISRVFWTGSPEMSPNISYYSDDEYPHKDFALSCGIRASFCFPFFNINHDSGWPDGVIEIVSTCNRGVRSVRKICESFEGLGLCLPGFISTNIRKYAIPEMDNLLDAVCRTFQFPLAQYWVAPDLFEALSMVHQYSYRKFENLAPWSQFKDACWHKSLTVGEGPLGNSCTSHDAFFCKDIAALSITNYPFAHYARNCGSISCFTIYLCYNSLPCTTCVLEFFLPAQEMDIYYPQTLLNSLWATMKERLPNHMLASGKQLGHGLSVGVINSSSSHNEPKSFEIGQPDRSLPHHEGSGYTCTLNMFENCTAQRVNSNSYEEAATEETLKTIPNEVTEIILEKLEDESHIKYIGPPSLASQPKRPINISQYEGNSNLVEMDHSADERVDEPEVSTVKDIGYATTTASKRAEKFTEPVTLESLHNQFRIPLDDTAKSFVEEPVERSNVEDLECAKSNTDVGCATSNTDVGCATSNADIVYAMTTASQPSRFQTMNMPCQLGEVETTVLENEESPIKCIEHRSLASQLRRSEEIFGDEGNSTVMIAHSTMEVTLKELVKHREHTVVSERVSEQVEKSPRSDDDVGYAMTIAARPFISHQTMIPKPGQEFQKKITLAENSAGKLTLSEDDTVIHFENKASTEARTSKRERKSEEEISFESLSEHFGRPLDDAATSFGVSRSTFKRICRDLGIKRWQYGKRRMDGDISSKLTGRLKNEEPSRRNFSHPNVTAVHDTVGARSGQDLNKMTVKVTYKGINIRFKLAGLSGIAELENNVIERLHLERKSFSIKYQDDEGDWVLIACDKDVQECMEISRSLKKTTIKLLLDPPINHCAP